MDIATVPYIDADGNCGERWYYSPPDTESCKKAYEAFEKYETWEYSDKRFEQACRAILDKIPADVRVVDDCLHKIDPHTYHKLAPDHPPSDSSSLGQSRD